MSFHPEILSQRQVKALRLLGPLTTAHNFYMGGGTAIALQLGHRRSVDFDWFREEPIRDPLLLGQELRERGVPFVTGWTERGTLYGTVNSVRVSFFQYRYRSLSPPLDMPEYDCRLASLRDLACMKLSAIAQRGSKKDFVDLYALRRSGFQLSHILEWYREKFDVQDIGHLLYALAYFDDADTERMPNLLWRVNWKEVKQDLREWIRRSSA